MTFVKSILTGIAGAVFAAVLWLLAVVILPIAAPLVVAGFTNYGSAGIGAVSVGSGPVLLVALIGFAIGFLWQFRRLSTRRLQSR
jgi:hypothetical protein